MNIDRHAEGSFRHHSETSKAKAMSGESQKALKVFKENPEGAEPHEGIEQTMDVALHGTQSDQHAGKIPGDPRLVAWLVQNRYIARWKRSRGAGQAMSLIDRALGETPEEGISDVAAGHGARKVQEGVNRRERGKRWGRNAGSVGILPACGLLPLKSRWRKETPRKASIRLSLTDRPGALISVPWLRGLWPGMGKRGPNSEEAVSSGEECPEHFAQGRTPHGKPRRSVGNDEEQGGRSQPDTLLRRREQNSGEQSNLMRGSRSSGRAERRTTRLS